MRASFSFDSDLNITLCKEDSLELIKGKTLETITDCRGKFFVKVRLKENTTNKYLDVYQKDTKQLKFAFNTKDFYLEGYHNDPELIAILGWDISLKRSTFEDYIKEEDNTSRIEPFWSRGLQFYCNIDRLHITYRNI